MTDAAHDQLDEAVRELTAAELDQIAGGVPSTMQNDVAPQ